MALGFFYRLFLEFVDREVQRNNSVNRVAIIGVGELGINVLRFLKNKIEKNEIKVIGFLSSNLDYRGRVIHNIPVLGNSKDLKNILINHNVQTVIDCEVSELSNSTKEFCNKNNIEYRAPVFDII